MRTTVITSDAIAHIHAKASVMRVSRGNQLLFFMDFPSLLLAFCGLLSSLSLLEYALIPALPERDAMHFRFKQMIIAERFCLLVVSVVT